MVGRAADAPTAAVENVRVDYNRFHVFASKQFLYGPNVVAVGEPMGVKRTAKRIVTS